MNIKPEALQSQLKNALPPCIWISGDDPLLLQESCDEVRAFAKTQGFADREVFHASRDFDWNHLIQAANSLSLFAERKIFDLRLASVKLDNNAKEALKYFVENPSEDNLLLISSPRIDKSMQKAKWFQAIEKPGYFVQVWPITNKDLPSWIVRRLKGHGMEADRDAVQLLADRVEGNLLAATQEIEQLAILSDSKQLNTRMVMQTVADSSRYSVFDLIDSCLLGDAARALKILSHLKAEGEEHLRLMNAMCAEVRSLITMREQIEEGHNINGVIQNFRVWYSRKAAVENALRNHSSQSLNGLLQLAQIIELSVKGRLPNNPWDELTNLTMGLSGKQNPENLFQTMLAC